MKASNALYIAFLVMLFLWNVLKVVNNCEISSATSSDFIAKSKQFYFKSLLFRLNHIWYTSSRLSLLQKVNTYI